LPLHLTLKEWSNILHWFLRGLPVVAIAQKTRVHRQRILRGLTYVSLKRRLSAKGGIRKERLPLYLAEYVWKYNHRNDSIDLQKKLILQQFGRRHV